MIWSLQHQSVSISSWCCCWWGFTFVLLQLIRPCPVCLGLVRLGPQTQWPTFTAADCGCCSRNLPFTANLDPPSLGSSGIHNSSYRSRTFSYLFSQICGIFPCPDFFLLLVPPPLLLCRFFSSAVFLPLSSRLLLFCVLSGGFISRQWICSPWKTPRSSASSQYAFNTAAVLLQTHTHKAGVGAGCCAQPQCSQIEERDFRWKRLSK